MGGYIHAPARHRRSGTTMQKMPSRGSLARANAARRVAPGFPAKPFERPEDIEAHIDGDRIDCLLCGRRFKTVLIHVVKIHGMDEAAYRERFNIPSRYVLAGRSTVAKLRENYNALDDGHPAKTRGGPEGMKAIRAKRPRGGTLKRAPVPMVAESWRTGIEAMNSNPAKPRMKDRIARGRNGAPGGAWAPDEHDWHLEQARLHERYRDIPPPAGRISWSAFKKRRNAEDDLNAAFLAARAAGKADRAARRLELREERRRLERIRVALPRPHLRLHDRAKAEDVLLRMARGRTLAEVASDPDIPPERWFRKLLAADDGLRQRYRTVVEALPFPLQSRMHMLGARFVEAVRSERSRGGVRRSDAAIAKALGVTAMTVNAVRRKHGID